MKTDYDCARCGIHVVCAVCQPDETNHCQLCRFIESISNPEERRQVAEAIDRTNPMFGGENGP